MPSERLNPFDLPIQRILVDWETGLPPWMKLVRASDEDNNSAFTRLSNEISAFAELITPTPKERLVRQNINDRLEAQVEKIWQGAKVVPIGSYAQDLYTSSSDIDLFISVPDIRESIENLELLHATIEKAHLAAPGTLTIVRSARIPIVKYTDSHSSGIQIDLSMNNSSATSSTAFVNHHLRKYPQLRPLTILLKQWLFQRKMNEVYNRGGLSSYALFLLILTVVQQFDGRGLAEGEVCGRTLVQFLRQWGSPTAFADVIRPLDEYMDKSLLQQDDPFNPTNSEGIQDPVNETNYIGRQTFSIREIQQEWQKSLSALYAAMDDYEKDVNHGRKKSILASIVGLTTREYESRKQINNVLLSDEMTVPSSARREIPSPQPELHPAPPRRIKYRNLLTPTGVIDVDEVNHMVDAKGRLRRRSDRGHEKDVAERGKWFVEITDDDIAIGQLVDLDGETVGDAREVYSACRDLETLTFSDETAEISTPSVPSYTTSPAMSTLSSNTSSLGRSLQSVWSAPQTEAPGKLHVSTPSNRPPEKTSLSTSSLAHFSNSPESKSRGLLRLTLGKPEPETTSSPLIAVSAGTIEQSMTDILVSDLVTAAAENTSCQCYGTTQSTMDDLAGLQFSVPEEATASDLRHGHPTESDIADRAFRVFSFGIKSRKV